MDAEYSSGSVDVAPAGWPKPVGVLSLIFGILAVTCGILGTGMWFATDAIVGSLMGSQMPPGTPAPPFAPPVSAILIGSAVFGLIVNTILIAAGVSLLKRKQNGRTMHLVYAMVAVLAAFVGSYAGYTGQQAQQQAMSAWIEQHGDEDDTTRQIADSQKQSAQMQGPIQVASLIGGLVVSLAWPVFCIVWFGIVKKVVPPAFEF